MKRQLSVRFVVQRLEALSPPHAARAGTESGVENKGDQNQFRTMPMSVEQIVSEARRLPREQAAELFDRLLVEAVVAPDVEVDAAWKREIRRRLAEIENGAETGVDGDTVMAELRQIVGR